MRSFFRYFLVTFFGGISTGLFGAAPTTDGIFPCGGKAGSSVEISLSGKADPWPPEFWCSVPKITFAPGEKSPNGTLSIPPGTTPGPCLLRFWNKEGSSEPILFLITDSKINEVLEVEKKENQSLTDAQIIETTLPAVIRGRLNPAKDVDCYRIALKKGETFYAFMEAYTFRTGLDSILHLYDSNGARLLLEHDNPLNQDPRVIFPVKEDGNYTLAVMAIATPPTASVFFHGGTKCSYQINLSLKSGDLPNRLLPEQGQKDADLSKTLTPPVDIFSTLKKAGQVDTVTFKAKAKETYLIDVEAFQHRFPTDPVLVLKNADGKLIKEIDDENQNSPDSSYRFSASADGDHIVTITDRYQRGGAEFRYQLRITKPEPDFSGKVEKSNYVMDAGKEASIKVSLTRVNDHKMPLKIALNNLPKSVTLMEAPKIPDKSGDLTLKLKASDEAPDFSGPILISLAEVEEEKPLTRNAVFSFRDDTTPAPILLDETEAIWLTVKSTNKKKPD